MSMVIFNELDVLERDVLAQMEKARVDYERQLETLRRVKLQLGKCRATLVQELQLAAAAAAEALSTDEVES